MDYRRQFPALENKVYGKPLIYFDNAATAQRAASVLDLQSSLSVEANANIHRAIHHLSAEATERYEAARDAVRSFINAPERENIVFTSGTTASINLLAACFTQAFVKAGDSIIISEAEHHSNIVPWQLACGRVGAKLKVLPVDERGEISLEAFENMLDGSVRLVSLTHISNILGIVNPVEEVIRIAHSHGIPVALDGAQGIVHARVDVQALDCDFYSFSGHKIYAPTGTGVLYGKREWMDQMPPYMGGGDMIDKVTFERTTYAPLPLKYEAGTQNFTGAACLKPALELAAEMAVDSEAEARQREMVGYMMEELGRVDGLRIYGDPRDRAVKVPLFSFSVEGAYASDMAEILDKMGIAVRSGHMCAEPLLSRFGQVAVLRASLAPYNSLEECEYFMKSLSKVVAMLR